VTKTRDVRGFTLLETMIALAIMVIAFASILMVESASLNTSVKARQMNVVAMLAKNKMVETEYKFEGKTFDEFKKEDGGQFDLPYQDYAWKMKVREVTFPAIAAGGGGKAGGDKDNAGDSDAMLEMITKLVTKFLSKSLREVTVTVSWKKGTGEQSYSLTTYWVDLNHEFETSE